MEPLEIADGLDVLAGATKDADEKTLLTSAAAVIRAYVPIGAIPRGTGTTGPEEDTPDPIKGPGPKSTDPGQGKGPL